jgi:hypothetical protein
MVGACNPCAFRVMHAASLDDQMLASTMALREMYRALPSYGMCVSGRTMVWLRVTIFLLLIFSFITSGFVHALQNIKCVM